MADLVIARRRRLAQLQPVERRFARDRSTILPPRRELASQHRHHRVMAQLVMVVQVLVAECQTEHALADERAHLMLDQMRRTAILEAGRKPLDQADRSIRGTQQQPAGIRCDRSPIKRSDNRTPLDACKSKLIRVTLRRHRGPPQKLIKWFSQNNFLRFFAPMHLPYVRYPG